MIVSSFKDYGDVSISLVSLSHSPDDLRPLHTISAEYNLQASKSLIAHLSDFNSDQVGGRVAGLEHHAISKTDKLATEPKMEAFKPQELSIVDRESKMTIRCASLVVSPQTMRGLGTQSWCK